MSINFEHFSQKIRGWETATAGMSVVNSLLAAAFLFAVAGGAKAALIEMPPLGPGTAYAKQGAAQYPFSWQSIGHYTAPDMFGGGAKANRLAGRAYPANGVTRLHDVGTHVLRTANGGMLADSDPFAAIDTPYGLIDGAAPLAVESDPELWTILLIAAGLIGYQLRRKSRIGAIRVRPIKL